MKLRSVFALSALMAAIMAPQAAFAEPGEQPTETLVVGGTTYTAENGLEIVETSKVVSGGGGTIGETFSERAPGTITPMAIWGTSYAYSVEAGSQVFYKGYAKASGNVYEGKRIAKVCMWYTQGSRTSKQVCAAAKYSGGSWQASPEAQTSFRDTLVSNAPKTVFHYQTYRVPIKG